MVRKYNYVPPNQQPPPNMGYPAAPQAPFEEEKTNTPEQWQRYPPPEQQPAPPPYPPAYSPAPPQSARPAPYGAPPGENQEYYRPPYQPGFPPVANQQYPPPNAQYPPPNQSDPPPNQQYPPQGYQPYNSTNPYRPQPPQAYSPQPYGGYNQPPPPQQYQSPLVDAPLYGTGTTPISYPYMPSYPPLNPTQTPPQLPASQRPQAPQVPPQAPQPEDERGVLGAIAGGAAGGFAGHKLNHGIIGTLGGAYAGHKLEDKYKEHHQKPAPPPIPTASRPQLSQNQAPPPVQNLGNFSMSSVNITLDKDYDLIASCGAINGEKKLSSISLNRCLTNDDGRFKWAKDGNFGASARNVVLVEGGRVLEAELRACDGGWRRSRIVLDEKITNEDGDLKML